MKSIKLYRTKKNQQLLAEKQAKLEMQYCIDHRVSECPSLFHDMEWFGTASKIRVTEVKDHGHYFEAYIPYEDVDRHYVIVPKQTINGSIEHNMFAIAKLLVQSLELRDKPFALVRKTERSINYPHWHLLFYE